MTPLDDNDRKARDDKAATEKESATDLSDQQLEDVEPDVDRVAAIASPEELRKTIRKMDLIVLPVMTVLLAFCFIDRSNMGLAAVAGMSQELDFKGYQYSISLLVFFPGYVIFVLPSSYVLQRTSVRYWLSFLTVTFGLFTLGAGLIRNFGGLVAMRVFLGICEAG
jgi:hypothetical protein